MLENTGQKTNQKHTPQKLKTTHQKQTTQNTAKQNYPGLVASYDTRPGNEVGLFYNAPEPTAPHGASHNMHHCKKEQKCK